MAYRLGSILIGFGLALASTGVAAAQTVDERALLVRPQSELAAAQREIPWYERFTAGATPTVRFSPSAPAVDPTVQGPPVSSRFGLSVDSSINEGNPLLRSDEASVTAFYRLSPTFQVRGKVSVAEQPQINAGGGKPLEPNSSVKIESVFKF